MIISDTILKQTSPDTPGALMYRKHLLFFFLWAVLIFPCGLRAENFPGFMDSLYKDNKTEIDAVLLETYIEGMAQVDGNLKDDQNKNRVIPMIFYHLLFTCTDATNCIRGGILEIPYFWHWVSPNPVMNCCLCLHPNLLSELSRLKVTESTSRMRTWTALPASIYPILFPILLCSTIPDAEMFILSDGTVNGKWPFHV